MIITDLNCISKGDVFKYHPFPIANCPDGSVRVDDISYIRQDVEPLKVINEILLTPGHTDGGNFKLCARDFSCYVTPFPLHYIVLRSLGFSFNQSVYEKVFRTAKRDVFLRLYVKNNTYYFDKESLVGPNKSKVRHISALHELQEQVRTLLGFEINVNVKKCNHILCLLYELDRYVASIESEISQNGMCMYTTISELCRESPYMPMPMEDVLLISSYMVDMAGYLMGCDGEGHPYLYKV